MKILSVDDDPIFLEIIKSELGILGYSNVTQVTSAADAIKAVREAKVPYDCFLLDIDMPDIDGIQLCSILRQAPIATTAPIIMVTVRSELDAVDRAFAAGATDYLNKPLNRQELRGRLQMTAALTQERVNRNSGAELQPISLSDPLPLDGVAASISYLAMQNYVLKLGALRLFSRVAIGIHISNIDDILATQDPIGFHHTILDVAEIISEAVVSGPKLISYAGSGDFVLLLNRVSGIDTETLIDQLSLKISELAGIYTQAGELVPRLKVGSIVGRGVMLLTPTDELLSHAIQSARSEGTEVSVPTSDSRSAAKLESTF